MNINLQAPANPLGYGVAGIQLALALNRLGHEVAWWFIGPSYYDDCYAPLIERMTRNQESYDASAPSLRIWHQFDMASRIGHGIHCGMPIFELDELTAREKHHLDALNKIFVCSRWAMGVVNRGLPHRIRDTYVVPLGVEREIFNESVGEPQKGWTTFLNVGKWEVRKGHDILIEAFNQAFTPRDRVRLWMMNYNTHLPAETNQEWQAKYTNTKMGKQVSFLPRVQSARDVAKIMGDADCGVFPARAEGWNLELLEMMSMGKQVIATDYSAHTEYCTNDNAHLIKVTDLEPAQDGLWFHGEGQWAKFGDSQMEQLVHYMRLVHKEHAKIYNIAGVETAKKFSWKAAAERLVKCLEMPSTDY